MADQTSPFGALLTPDVLAAQRRAKFEQEYEGQNPWVKLAADAGFNMREMDRARGIGLTPEDIKARRNNEIMTQAQSKHAELVKSGKMTADEAQAGVLEDAIKQFAANGEWEQALALTQPLNTLRSQEAERRKLRADAAYSESRPEAKQIDQELASIRADMANAAKVEQLRIMEKNADTAYDKLGVMLQIAEIRAQQAQDTADAKASKESPAAYKERVKVNTAVMSAADAGHLMADLREQIKSSPGALSATGDFATKMAAFGLSARTALQKSNFNPDELRGGGSASEWAKLNVKNAQQRALVINLAYAFARANDPGGRLSNQDLEQAMRVVSGEGGPEARLAVLDNAFTGLARATEGKIGALQDGGGVLGPNTIRRFQQSMSRYSSLTKADVEAAKKPAAAATTAPASKDGWTDLGGGVKIREKQ